MLLVQPFHDDKGTGLFCQSWNQKWHLIGITQPNDGDIEGRSATWPSMRAGLNVVSDIQVTKLSFCISSLQFKLFSGPDEMGSTRVPWSILV